MPSVSPKTAGEKKALAKAEVRNQLTIAENEINKAFPSFMRIQETIAKAKQLLQDV